MKKIIPEQIVYFCDRCKVELTDSQISAKGEIIFIGRDIDGHAVGGYSNEFELCKKCTNNIKEFFGEN